MKKENKMIVISGRGGGGIDMMVRVS